MGLRTTDEARLRELAGRLRRFARSRVHDDEEAQDLVQETLAAALGGGAAFAGRSLLGTWLVAILLNKIADRRRAALRARRTFVDADATGGESGEPRQRDAVDDWSDPCRVVEARQELRVLAGELGRLPARSRAAFVMLHAEGRGRAEICAALAVTPGNLAVLLHRARRTLDRNLRARGALPGFTPPAVPPSRRPS